MTLISPLEVQQLELENIRPTHLTCSKCKKVLPIEQFPSRKDVPSHYGKDYWCRFCHKKNKEEWKRENPLSFVISSARTNLKYRPHLPKEFNIDVDYLKQIDTTDICPILEIPMRWWSGYGNGQTNPNAKSLDRIDSSRGYIKGNVIIISWRANKIKNNANLEELIKLGQWAQTHNHL
tara:strand:- start:33 stop:566 length:534 start_codon:yes stop_codon:yes gene_type:complete